MFYSVKYTWNSSNKLIRIHERQPTIIDLLKYCSRLPLKLQENMFNLKVFRYSFKESYLYQAFIV